MKKQILFLSLLGSLIFFYACQKELSLEVGKNASEGSLQSNSTNDCLPKVVAGAYEQGKPLDGTVNYIEVEVIVTKPGAYTIYTDTLNGIYFRATGIFTTAGTNTVRLKGNGTPFSTGITNFVVTYGNSECLVSVTILPAGGSGPAVFSLAGAPGTCMNYVLSGTYTANTLLSGSSNNVVINVNVTTIGIYNITTIVSNGITFSGTGVLSSLGAQTITLVASGTPLAAGNTPIPVTVGSSSCSFNINVTGAATYTIDCNSAVVSGTYEAGTLLDATNFVDIDVNVSVVGGYSITGSINGMTFAASGNFTTTGIKTVTLQGTGTPVTDGQFNVPLTGGTAGCSFAVTVDPGSTIIPATGTWQFKQGSTTYQGTFSEAEFDATSLAPALFLYFYGQSMTGEEFEVDLVDLSGAIQSGETYSMSNPAGNFGGVYYASNTEEYSADPSVTGVTMTLTVTNHNTTTKTITGTFSGKAQDINGVLIDITNGSFTLNY